MTTTADVNADRAQAIRHHLRIIEALLDGKGADVVEKADARSWPPAAVDLRDPYWQWCTIQQAADHGPYKETKLNQIRHLVSKKIGGQRWFSLRRIFSDYTAPR